MPEAFPGAIITFPMLGESFSLNPSGTYTLFGHTFYWYGAIIASSTLSWYFVKSGCIIIPNKSNTDAKNIPINIIR